MLRSPAYLTLLASLLVFSLAAAPADAADDPNIIYILADDLGYGELGCYGQEKIKTPNLDRMAREGMRFTQHYAGSTVCAPSRCVLMTGKHLGQAFIRGNSKLDLRPDDVTLAEVLKQAGYYNALVGKWGLGHEGSSGVPTRQGFDEFFGYLDQHHAHNYYPTFLVRNEQRVPLENVVPDEGRFGNGVATVKKQYSHDLFMHEALEFLDENKDRRFFLYLALTIPHANNEAGENEVPDLGPYAERDWPLAEKKKAAMITRMDRGIGELLARLKKHGLDENTIVLFSSDNGPHREGGNRPEFFQSSGPLRGIKRALYDGGIRVPLIVRWPGKIEAGSTSDLVSYHGDMMATFADLAGTTPPSEIHSISIVPTLLGSPEKQKQHEYLYWEFYEGRPAQAVRLGEWKAVRSPIFTGEIELYHVESDLAEAHDLADEHPELVERVAAIMEEAHVPSEHWKVPSPARKSKGTNKKQ